MSDELVLWWGGVRRECWTDEMRAAALETSGVRLNDPESPIIEPTVVVIQWHARPDLENAYRQIKDLIGVDAAMFDPGFKPARDF